MMLRLTIHLLNALTDSIMKNSLSFYIIALLSLFISCNKEAERNTKSASSEDADVVQINLSAETKATMSDLLGINWAVDDIIFWRNQTGSANASYTLTALDITDGNRASFKTAIPNISTNDVYGVFRYNNHPDLANNESVFSDLNSKPSKYGTPSLDGDKLIIHQEAAGIINPAILSMHSGESAIMIKQGTSEITLEMEIVGTVFRVLPFTSTYQSEKIQKIIFSSSSVIAGTIRYDYSNGDYTPPCWANIKEYEVDLDAEMSLSGVSSAETSHGIYFSLPKTDSPISGYRYVVVTDVAKYTFVSAADLSVGTNKVKNVLLNLDKASRIELAAVMGDLKYQGGIANGSTINRGAAAVSDYAYGYYEAYIKDSGEVDWTMMSAASNFAKYYSPAVFSIIDDATGLEATWVSAHYRTNDSWILFSLDENTSTSARNATLTVTFPSVVDGYVLLDGYSTLVLHIVQNGAVSEENKVQVWTAAPTFNYLYYAHAPGWTVAYEFANEANLTALTYSIGTNSFSITMPCSPNERWQSQNWLYTGIVLNSVKSYDFACDITSDSASSASVLVKAFPSTGGNSTTKPSEGANLFNLEKSVSSASTTHYAATFSGVGFGGDDHLMLMIDFGATTEGTQFSVTNISLKEY